MFPFLFLPIFTLTGKEAKLHSYSNFGYDPQKYILPGNPTQTHTCKLKYCLLLFHVMYSDILYSVL